MEPELIVVEECNRYFIVQQRWGLDHPTKGRSDSWSATNRREFEDLFPCAYIFTPMAGPYARVYREWCSHADRGKRDMAFGYIVEARTKRQVVDKMVELGHPAMFNSTFYYPKDRLMDMCCDNCGSYPCQRERGCVDSTFAADPDIRALQRTIERAQAKIDFIASLPDEPPVDEDGVAVIFFRKRFGRGGRPYDYAAIKAGDGLWYTTGPASPKGYSWSALIKWIFDGSPDTQILVASEWVEI